MWEFTQGRNLIAVIIARDPSIGQTVWLDTLWEFTQGRNPKVVIIARNPSIGQTVWLDTWKIMQGRNSIVVITARSPSIIHPVWLDTGEIIQRKTLYHSHQLKWVGTYWKAEGTPYLMPVHSFLWNLSIFFGKIKPSPPPLLQLASLL